MQCCFPSFRRFSNFQNTKFEELENIFGSESQDPKDGRIDNCSGRGFLLLIVNVAKTPVIFCLCKNGKYDGSRSFLGM